MYSDHSSKPESRRSSLQTSDRRFTVCPTWQQHDQRVPFNMTGTPTAAGKENQMSTKLEPIISSYSSKKDCLINKDVNENKRSNAQILALFTSSKNASQLETVDRRENTESNKHTNTAENGEMNMQHSRLDEPLDNKSSTNDVVKLRSCTKDIAISTSEPKPGENNSLESNQMISEDLCNSINLSPDSFAACSSDTNCTLFDDDSLQGSHICDVSREVEGQESAVSKSPYNSQRQNDLWSQNDSESVSPLMRKLSCVGNGRAQVCVDLSEEGDWPCKKGTMDCSKRDPCKFESPDSAAVKEASSVMLPSLDLCSTTQSPHCFQESIMIFSDPDLMQASPLPKPHLMAHRSELNSTCVTVAAREVVTHSSNSDFNIETKGLSSHPGSLFAYGALQRQFEQTKYLEGPKDARINNDRLSNLKLCNTPSFEFKCVEDMEDSLLQSGVSPEFYPPTRDKTAQWRAAAVGTTKVIPSDSRTVSTCFTTDTLLQAVLHYVLLFA